MHFFIKQPHPKLNWDASREQDDLAVLAEVLSWDKCAAHDPIAWIYDDDGAPAILEQLQEQQSAASSMRAQQDNDRRMREFLHGRARQEKWRQLVANEAMRLLDAG